MPYSTAWIVIAVLAVIGAFCLNSLLRGAGPGPARWPRKLRYIFVLLVFVFFLLPAPLPNHAGVFAPAFVVYLFDQLLRVCLFYMLKHTSSRQRRVLAHLAEITFCQDLAAYLV